VLRAPLIVLAIPPIAVEIEPIVLDMDPTRDEKPLEICEPICPIEVLIVPAMPESIPLKDPMIEEKPLDTTLETDERAPEIVEEIPLIIDPICEAIPLILDEIMPGIF
jgi:hypothetical protein